MHGFGTTNCETSGTPEFFRSCLGTVFISVYLISILCLCCKAVCWKAVLEAGSHAERMRLCGEFAAIFRCFEAAFMGSKFSKTAEVFPECSMAESPKSVTVETEGVAVPPGSGSASAYPVSETGFAAAPTEGGATEVPGSTTAEEQSLPVVPASKITMDLSPAAPPTPMTQDEGGDDDVYVTPKTKKPKLHQEISALGDRVSQAVDAMNTVSKAMVDMCSEYKRESTELQESIRAMGLQGIANKGYLATLVAFQGEMKDINWQLTGSGKSHANSSMKSVGIGIGDKLVSLHQLGKELLKCTNENHKSLMEGLSALELAIKQMAPVNVPLPPQAEMSGLPTARQPEMSGLPTARMYEQNMGPQYGLPSAPSHAGHGAAVEVPQPPRFEIPQRSIRDGSLQATATPPGGPGELSFKVAKGRPVSGLCRRTQLEQKIHHHKVGPKNMGWETWSLGCTGTVSCRIPLSQMLNPTQTCENGLELFL